MGDGRWAMGDEGIRSGGERAVNDNGGLDGADPEALRRLDAAALRFARIVGRRMAREDFATRMAAPNDNAPPAREVTEEDP